MATQAVVSVWADTAEIDFDMLFEAYVAYIHKPLAAKVG